MNKTLSALMTKLQRQLDEYRQQLQKIEQQCEDLEQPLLETEQNILNASVVPGLILPEREIAGLHYIMSKRQLQDDLKANKRMMLSQQTALKSKIMRLETELKMLEKHQTNQIKKEQQKLIVTEQNTVDEWVIQGRTHDEN